MRRYAWALLGAGNFWYWVLLLGPPEHDSGVNYANAWEWLSGLAVISLVAGIVERRAEIAATSVAAGQALTFIQFSLFGMASGPPQFAVHSGYQAPWSLVLIVPTLIYFGISLAMAIGPAGLGEVIGHRLDLMKKAKAAVPIFPVSPAS